MPDDEGLALYRVAASLEVDGPLVEVGTYCGKSAIYLGAAAQSRDRMLFTVDHHRGSEENQPGWEHHEADLVDPEVGLMDTLPEFRRNISAAGLEDTVVAIVGESSGIAAHWEADVALLFIDGGHGEKPAAADYQAWSPKVAPGGILAIHDIFDDPAQGGQAPRDHIYRPAVESGDFREIEAVGSLRVLRRQ